MVTWRHVQILLVVAASLSGCASFMPADPVAHQTRAVTVLPPPAAGSGPWEHQVLPGKKPSQFRAAQGQGRPALAVTSEAAASMLRAKVRVEAAELGAIRFSWRVPQLIAQADLAVRDRADSPARIILAFEGDRSKFSPRDAMLNELARSVTGEEMPYATLIYVWGNAREPGTVVRSPRTERIRKLVVESGAGRLDQWLDYERDIRADFERAFGESPGALVGIAIMTDTDNTRGRARAYYGPVTLLAPARP
jgi:hypothetical protein